MYIYHFNDLLGGGFKYFLFSPLPGADSHFDWYFSNGSKPPISFSWVTWAYFYICQPCAKRWHPDKHQDGPERRYKYHPLSSRFWMIPQIPKEKKVAKKHQTTFWKCLVKMFGIFIFLNFVVLKVNIGYRFKSLSCVSSLSTKEIDLHGWNVEWVEITAEITTQLIMTFNFRISSFRFYF